MYYIYIIRSVGILHRALAKDNKAKSEIFDLRTMKMTEGDLPGKAQELVEEWMAQNQKALLEMWDSQNLKKLPPL